jgi:hypothetical protein
MGIILLKSIRGVLGSNNWMRSEILMILLLSRVQKVRKLGTIICCLSINERPISKTRRNSVGTLSEGKFLIPIPGVLSITSFTKSIIS